MALLHSSICKGQWGGEQQSVLMGITGRRGELNPMLEKILSKVRHILIDAHQRLSVESAAAIEQVYNDIVILNDFISQELYAVESNSSLDAINQKVARRGVFEQAGRKLEVLKKKKNYSKPSKTLEIKSSNTPVGNEDSLLQFLREKEVRDRLFNMTEAQILFLFGDSLFDGTNSVLLRAIMNAPAGLEPVSKETLKKMQQSRVGKVSPESANDRETARNLNSMVEEIFSLVKKELDNLRQKELPTILNPSKDSEARPFKF